MLLQKKRLSLVASQSDNESIDGRSSLTPPSSLDRSSKTRTTDERAVVIKVRLNIFNFKTY